MVHWRMLPNIKNKTNSIYYLPHNKRIIPIHIGRPLSPRHQNQWQYETNKRQKNKQKWMKELGIITTHEIRGKLPQRHTSILNTVM